jgi:hypothetical protein
MVNKKSNSKSLTKPSAKSKAKGVTNNGNSRGPGQRFQAPAAIGRVITTQSPSVSGSPYIGDGRTTIRHREYIGEIAGSVDFAVSSYNINPGMVGTFPWTARYPAQGYESYVFNNLCFYFESEKSSNTNGSIMLAVDYDAADAAPPNKTQLMAYHNAVRANVWMECKNTSSRQDLTKFGVQRYIRSGALSANQDIKTFDVGTLFVATQGCADTTKIGELYVEYEVVLHTPQLDISASAQWESVNISAAVSISDTVIFGTTPTYTGGLLVVASGSTLTFNQVGQYILYMTIAGTGIAAGPVVTGTATTTSVNETFNGAGTLYVGGRIVKINNVGETVILDMSAATTVTGGNYRIGAYAYSNA